MTVGTPWLQKSLKRKSQEKGPSPSSPPPSLQAGVRIAWLLKYLCFHVNFVCWALLPAADVLMSMLIPWLDFDPGNRRMMSRQTKFKPSTCQKETEEMEEGRGL